MIQFLLAVDYIEKVGFYFFTVLDSGYFKFFANLFNAKNNPSAGCVGECTDGLPNILWELSRCFLHFKVIPLDVFEFG